MCDVKERLGARFDSVIAGNVWVSSAFGNVFIFSPRPFFVLLKMIIVTISMIKQKMFKGNPGNTGHGGGKDDGETGASFLIFALFTFP